MKFVTRAVSGTIAPAVLAALIAQSSAAFGAEAPTLPTTAAVVKPTDSAQVPQDADQLADAPTLTAADIQPGDTVAYPTLAAAVRAQPSDAGDDDAELRCLAGAIYFESRGEPLAGQLGVAEVILNRATSGRFARGICGVVTQPGQFSFVRGGHVPEIGDNADYRTALAVAKVALKEAWESDASNALYFNARTGAPGGKARVASIGNHVFYR